jgi:hypothetical protein
LTKRCGDHLRFGCGRLLRIIHKNAIVCATCSQPLAGSEKSSWKRTAPEGLASHWYGRTDRWQASVAIPNIRQGGKTGRECHHPGALLSAIMNFNIIEPISNTATLLRGNNAVINARLPQQQEHPARTERWPLKGDILHGMDRLEADIGHPGEGERGCNPDRLAALARKNVPP